MKYSELEKELDEYLAWQIEPVQQNVENWSFAVDEIERELAEEFDAIDKKTMMRVIAKSIAAYDKQSLAHERTIERAKAVIDDMRSCGSAQIESFRVFAHEMVDQVPKDTARKAAIARHATTYAKHDEIIAYWREKIGSDKSNEFAAELLQKEFPEVAHRTLARYVAGAKKLPLASTL